MCVSLSQKPQLFFLLTIRQHSAFLVEALGFAKRVYLIPKGPLVQEGLAASPPRWVELQAPGCPQVAGMWGAGRAGTFASPDAGTVLS